jgi:hypothetical protein
MDRTWAFSARGTPVYGSLRSGRDLAWYFRPESLTTLWIRFFFFLPNSFDWRHEILSHFFKADNFRHICMHPQSKSYLNFGCETKKNCCNAGTELDLGQGWVRDAGSLLSSHANIRCRDSVVNLILWKYSSPLAPCYLHLWTMVNSLTNQMDQNIQHRYPDQIYSNLACMSSGPSIFFVTTVQPFRFITSSPLLLSMNQR